MRRSGRVWRADRVDGGENAIFAIPQANLALTPEHIEAARPAIEAADMLLVQFEVGMEATLAAMRIAREAGVRVMLNPAPLGPFPEGMLELATVIVANEIEAAALVPTANGDHALELAGLRCHAPMAVVTLGELGAVADEGGGAANSAFEVKRWIRWSPAMRFAPPLPFSQRRPRASMQHGCERGRCARDAETRRPGITPNTF